MFPNLRNRSFLAVALIVLALVPSAALTQAPPKPVPVDGTLSFAAVFQDMGDMTEAAVKYHRAKLRRSIMSFCVLCALLFSAAGSVGQNDPSAMAKDYQALELELLTRLQEKGLWTDEKQKPKLLAYLDVDERMKPASLIPLLIEHLEYDVYAKAPDSRPLLPVQKQCPAVGVLAEIGLSAIPPLIELLKKTDPKDHKRFLAIVSLRLIYEKAGFGVQQAKQRIELEMKTVTGKEEANLKEALKYPLFNR